MLKTGTEDYVVIDVHASHVRARIIDMSVDRILELEVSATSVSILASASVLSTAVQLSTGGGGGMLG